MTRCPMRPSGAVPLAAALALSLSVLSSCGGSATPSTPVTPSTPTPTPVAATPTPDPNIPPAGSGCGQPYPPDITRFGIKIAYKLQDYWIIDSTPLVGPDGAYCAAIGFTDGRLICPIRPEGAPDRSPCEIWRAGMSKDTPPRAGPTWTLTTKDGVVHYCTGLESGCEHFVGDDGGPFQIKAYTGGLYTVCSALGACADVDVDRGL
jgi:hypothetical protein